MIFSVLQLHSLTYIHIFSSALCSPRLSLSVLSLVRETKFHTYDEQLLKKL
jgi:hypothetical protein